ncbi:MAG TPA: DUF1844 domain-containing protein [Pirellulales bacterium]|jgi:hypothetical protein|nr:DUF1844 domain-containing protein [Pirellulales bacterium]
MNEQTGESPKIIVDEGWKERVEAEKQAAAAKQAEQHKSTSTPAPSTATLVQSAAAPAQSASGSASSAAPPASAAAGPTSRAPIPPPPATLEFLITTLATQAMMALGQMVNPLTGKADVRLSEAKHFIDMLTVLEEKTVGNRTPDESALLDGFLHELRMAFVMSQTA